MKRSIKKYLILALVIMAMVVTSVFVASAANVRIVCPEHGRVSAVVKQIIAPTCDATGYSIYGCPVAGCTTLANGEYDVVSNRGHKYGDPVFVKVEDHYESVSTCLRTGCDYKVTESDEDAEVVKYYNVKLINKKATAATLEGHPFADVATDYKDVTVADVYLKPGETIEVGAIRERDKVNGAYEFNGWAEDKDAPSGEKIIKIAAAPEKADFVYYATFKADDTVKYTVRFVSAEGYNIDELAMTVNHGGSLDLRDVKWQKADDIEYRYSFSKWVWENNHNVEVNSNTVFYGAPNLDNVIYLRAVFSKEPRQYRLKYYYKDGKTPIMYNGAAAEDNVTLGSYDDNHKDEPVVGDYLYKRAAIEFPELYSYKDRNYIYYFTGNWILQNGSGTTIYLNKLNLKGLLDNKQNKEGYKLIPEYEPETRLYKISVKVMFADNGENHPSEIVLAFNNSNGEHVAGARLSEPDEGKNYYTYTASVPYSNSYEIVATATAYMGKITSDFDSADEAFSNVEITMEHVGRDNCSCLCHSFLKPIWVKVLNLMNTLFKKKIVCCDDMYASIGHLLNYSN